MKKKKDEVYTCPKCKRVHKLGTKVYERHKKHLKSDKNKKIIKHIKPKKSKNPKPNIKPKKTKTTIKLNTDRIKIKGEHRVKERHKINKPKNSEDRQLKLLEVAKLNRMIKSRAINEDDRRKLISKRDTLSIALGGYKQREIIAR